MKKISEVTFTNKLFDSLHKNYFLQPEASSPSVTEHTEIYFKFLCQVTQLPPVKTLFKTRNIKKSELLTPIIIILR